MTSKKIAFIGAGSFSFTRELVRDILTFPAFADCTIALMDIDTERLAAIKKAVDKIVAAGRYPAQIIATSDRAEALRDADGVICTILSGGVNIWRHDLEIPEAYGIDLNVGDTRGPAGIFRALRTIPVMLNICADIERYCPDALLLNYTNPMSMLCRAMQGQTRVKVTGLCHSVPETAEMLARWIDAPLHEITYRCAGINHQAWFIDYKWNGRDAYPLIREAVLSRPEIYNEEQVRNEMFLHLDCYVTESSGHNSEYTAWFRKSPALIERFCTHGTGWNPGVHNYELSKYMHRATSWRDELTRWLSECEIDPNRGSEYAAYIFNSVFGDHTPFLFNGNTLNHGLVDNLLSGACVEIPMLAAKGGLSAIWVGAIPPQLAALNNLHAACEEMAVEASREGDPRKVFHAICMDPLTSAMLTLSDTKSMVDDMMKANRDYLPQFKHLT